ncbi:MAG: lipoyl synthase [Myxococcota bacterium]
MTSVTTQITTSKKRGLPVVSNPPPAPQRPSWLRVRAPSGKNYEQLRQLVENKHLHTVCASASCPNMGECWERGTATFMILGNTCSRACRFCHVDSGRPDPVDLQEPQRLAQAAALMQLRHVVITSVARDDLPDGGAGHFAHCLQAVHEQLPQAKLEVLVPDFAGEQQSIATVLEPSLSVFNHNLETVKRLTPRVRSKATYERSLHVLATAKRLAPHIQTKSGLMLGLGEQLSEVQQALHDLRSAGVSIVTLGQYLRPSPRHTPMDRFVPPEEFDQMAVFARSLGFIHVESGPLVRSSYHAERAVSHTRF